MILKWIFDRVASFIGTAEAPYDPPRGMRDDE